MQNHWKRWSRDLFLVNRQKSLHFKFVVFLEKWQSSSFPFPPSRHFPHFHFLIPIHVSVFTFPFPQFHFHLRIPFLISISHMFTFSFLFPFPLLFMKHNIENIDDDIFANLDAGYFQRQYIYFLYFSKKNVFISYHIDRSISKWMLYKNE